MWIVTTPVNPLPVAVLVVVLFPAPEAAIGPTMHVVAPPMRSGSVKVHAEVSTSGSVTLIELKAIAPVLMSAAAYVLLQELRLQGHVKF